MRRGLVAVFRLVLASFCAIAVTVPTVAHATIVVEQSRAQLVASADLIVRATVVGQQSTWSEDGTQIVTLTRLRVARYLKGQGAGELTLRQFGGRIGTLASRVAGDARFEPGQDVVLFLRQGAGVVYLTALAQSAYFVVPSATGASFVHRDLTDTTFAVLRAGQYALTEPTREPVETVDHLLADLAAAVGAGR
jgi:hypothetical protein